LKIENENINGDKMREIWCEEVRVEMIKRLGFVEGVM
jgi:hypothetical protein